MKDRFQNHSFTGFQDLALKPHRLHYGIDSNAQLLDEVINIPGHPIHVLMVENQHILALTKEGRSKIEVFEQKKIEEWLRKLQKISKHYAKKGDLLLTLLDAGYGISGPSENMWQADDDVRNEIRQFIAEDFNSSKLLTVLDRIDLMVQKEEQVLFPLCMKKFTEEDWMRIYYDMSKYEPMIEEYPLWSEAEEARENLRTIGGDLAKNVKDMGEEVELLIGTGRMTRLEIEHLLYTIPLELTFIDKEGFNRFFSEKTPIFKRPDMAIGRHVSTCHTPKIQAKAERIIESFKEGKDSAVEMWMEIDSKPVFVRYLAVRDVNGAYLGTLEVVQDMTFAKDHFLKEKNEQKI